MSFSTDSKVELGASSTVGFSEIKALYDKIKGVKLKLLMKTSMERNSRENAVKKGDLLASTIDDLWSHVASRNRSKPATKLRVVEQRHQVLPLTRKGYLDCSEGIQAGKLLKVSFRSFFESFGRVAWVQLGSRNDVVGIESARKDDLKEKTLNQPTECSSTTSKGNSGSSTENITGLIEDLCDLPS